MVGMIKLADPWRVREGRWFRTSGPFVVAQVTEHMWYVLREGGSGGVSGSTATIELARRRVDRVLLGDGWELSF